MRHTHVIRGKIPVKFWALRRSPVDGRFPRTITPKGDHPEAPPPAPVSGRAFSGGGWDTPALLISPAVARNPPPFGGGVGAGRVRFGVVARYAQVR